MRCRLCGAETKLLAYRADVVLERCQRCHFVSGEPRQHISPIDRYQNYYHAPSPTAPERRYRQWLARAESIVGCGNLLEVGAGAGAFVRVARSRGWNVYATEISGTAIPTLRGTGATIFFGDLASAQYPESFFDVVVSLEVLEHLPTPGECLREIWRLTRPGGLLLLTTPNFNGLSRRYLGMRWRVIDPEHTGYFTSVTISRLLREVGYKSVAVTSRSLDILSWRRGSGPAGSVRFDPHASACLRETVEGSTILRLAKDALNGVLRLTGLGDSLIVWARR
jgi:2-polyprenyl-3-methyl-5-hydroxy-6-metoxy-1,4-benzoquinol methylase